MTLIGKVNAFLMCVFVLLAIVDLSNGHYGLMIAEMIFALLCFYDCGDWWADSQ
jgi:hypothetical protein